MILKEDSMKIFDIHMHVFPDAVAEKAVRNLGNYYKVEMASKGTLEDFKKSLSKSPEIKKCLIHSTATAPHQVQNVNNFVASLKDDKKIYGFGSIHPDYDDIENEIDRMISLGLRGIKIHSDFQEFNVDCKKACKIYEVAEGRLPILFHAGDENVDSSSPKRLRHVHDMFPRLKMIAAHLGGYSAWDDSEKYLVGEDVYFDTSSTLQAIDPKQAIRIIRSHGIERCMFGTDYPMHYQDKVIEMFLKLGFSDDELYKLLWKNAHDFLGIEE